LARGKIAIFSETYATKIIKINKRHNWKPKN